MKRYLNSTNPCRGCGVTEARYEMQDILHDEASCMRAHGIRFFLGVPVGTRVVLKGVSGGPIGIVQRSSPVPWVNYRIGFPDGPGSFHVEPQHILDILPQDMSDTEAVERWLASG